MIKILTTLPKKQLSKLGTKYTITSTTPKTLITKLKTPPHALLITYSTDLITSLSDHFAQSNPIDLPIIGLVRDEHNTPIPKTTFSKYITTVLSNPPSISELRAFANTTELIVKQKTASQKLETKIQKTEEKLAREKENFKAAKRELTSTINKAQTMYTLSKTIHSTLDLDQILRSTSDMLAKLLSAKSIVILLFNDQRNRLVAKVARNRKSLLNTEFKVMDDRIVRKDKKDPAIPKEIKKRMTQKVMTLPIKTPRGVQGIISITDKKDDDKFTKDHFDILTEITQQLAKAITNIRLFASAETLAQKDPLTQLFNRAYFNKSLSTEFQKAKENDYHLSVLMFDIDFFKAVNDTYGHPIGDEILKKVANILRRTVRKTDIITRYGGEEMVGLLIGAKREEATKVAEKVRKRIEAIDLYAVEIISKHAESKYMLVERDPEGDYNCLLFPLLTNADNDHARVERMWIESLWLKKIRRDIEERQKLNVESHKKLKIAKVKITVSIGVATYPQDFADDVKLAKSDKDVREVKRLVDMSDKALYRAKNEGRNRTITFQQVHQFQDAKSEKEIANAAIENLLKRLKTHNEKTYYHSLRLSAIATLVAKKMKLNKDTIDKVTHGALLHDIGKIKIPNSIINKPARLTDDEYEFIKTHVAKGVELLEQFAPLHKYINGVRHHHEKWEGFGYPEGISGDRIPMESRIIAVCDSYDAMMTRKHNVHREDGSKFDVIEELIRCKDAIYDAKVVDAFVENLEDIKALDLRNETLERL